MSREFRLTVLSYLLITLYVLLKIKNYRILLVTVTIELYQLFGGLL